jgi:hypothetical protein
MAAATSSATTKGKRLQAAIQPMTCCSGIEEAEAAMDGRRASPDHKARPQDHQGSFSCACSPSSTWSHSALARAYAAPDG